jgi:DNA-nicking Smr family endonuclease
MSDDDASDPAAVEMPIDGILDLHAFRPEETAELVSDYLDECAARGILEIRIIHGKGKGTLRRTVHAVLERRSDVLRFGLAPPERGGWGATLVTLRRGAGGDG